MEGFRGNQLGILAGKPDAGKAWKFDPITFKFSSSPAITKTVVDIQLLCV
jgi:hypothetical protein